VPPEGSASKPYPSRGGGQARLRMQRYGNSHNPQSKRSIFSAGGGTFVPHTLYIIHTRVREIIGEGREKHTKRRRKKTKKLRPLYRHECGIKQRMQASQHVPHCQNVGQQAEGGNVRQPHFQERRGAFVALSRCSNCLYATQQLLCRDKATNITCRVWSYKLEGDLARLPMFVRRKNRMDLALQLFFAIFAAD